MVLAIVRYAAALMIMAYGFAKINGSQFTILDSELDKPMGQVSGFWLTWYYFGYSKIYGNFIALVQIGGAFLLTFRRTTLLGTCLLAPVLGNIVLVDIFYGVEPVATLMAIILLVIMLGLISAHFRDLVELFWVRQKTTLGSRFAGAGAVKWVVRVAMVVTACGLTYWLANYNNRAPTPIDGAWEVVRVEPTGLAGKIPRRIYFEYNRAFLVVFKFADGSYANHHFQASPENHGLQIWQKWLSKGSRVFSGGYLLDGTKLSLRGEMENVGTIGLELERRQVR
jgi:hypothetical protein